MAVNSPTNFAGEVGSVSLQSVPNRGALLLLLIATLVGSIAVVLRSDASSA